MRRASSARCKRVTSRRCACGATRPRSSSLSRRISDAIRERGPMTVAAFMEHALYDPTTGYYARAARRSGRAGDFFTSVDVGPLFGELLAAQIAEMAELVKAQVSSLKSQVKFEVDTSLETSD